MRYPSDPSSPPAQGAVRDKTELQRALDELMCAVTDAQEALGGVTATLQPLFLPPTPPEPMGVGSDYSAALPQAISARTSEVRLLYLGLRDIRDRLCL